MKRFSFLREEQASAVEAAMQKRWLTRMLTSYTALAFCYGLFLFLYELPLIREPVAAVHPVLIAWTGVLTVYSIVVRRLWEKLPMWPALAVFIVAGLVTALLNRQVGLVSNIKGWVLAVLPLMAFLPLCLLEEDREKALLKALSGGAAVALMASLAAIVMYLLRVSTRVELFGSAHMVGYCYYIPNEPESGILLYGLYADTNFASGYAVIFAAYSLWLLDACRRGVCGKAVKGFAIVNLIVQVIYFPLANSRGGWLCLVIAGVVCVFLYAFCTRLKTEGKWKRAWLSLVAAVVCVALVCGGLLLLRSAVSMVSNAIHYTPEPLPPVSTDPTGDTVVETGNQWSGQSMDIFQKDDDGFGAGRLIIWGEALQLFTFKPLLGTGPNNGTYFARLYDFGQRLRDGFSLHNSFLDVLVYFGAVGFAALMSFFGTCLWLTLRSFFGNGGSLTGKTYLCAFGVLFLAGVSLFLSCCFINTTAMYYLMLCLLSFLLAECKDVKK